MPRLRIVSDDEASDTPTPLRFPTELTRSGETNRDDALSAEQALAALDNVSRRIDDLARQLNCLGWFDDDDGPRAA
jgi:hypothetical protein